MDNTPSGKSNANLAAKFTLTHSFSVALEANGPFCRESLPYPWDALYAANVGVVINGHDHDYERFAPQDPSGKLDSRRGIRKFVVGTGGKSSHRTFASTQPNSEVRQADTFGVLKLTLRATSYDWEFVSEAGRTFTDSGGGTCH